MGDESGFLSFVDRESGLHDTLGGFRDGDGDLLRVDEDSLGELTNFWRHGSGEHERLAVLLREILDDLHDIVKKAHV